MVPFPEDCPSRRLRCLDGENGSGIDIDEGLMFEFSWPGDGDRGNMKCGLLLCGREVEAAGTVAGAVCDAVSRFKL